MSDPYVRADAPRRRKGCLGWGCLILFLILLLIGGCVGFGLYWLRNEAMKITEEEAWPLPRVEAGPAEAEGLQSRAEAFRAAPPPAQLEISAAELNALMTQDPELAQTVRARIEGDRVFFDVSYPMSRLPPPISTMVGSRWFNGTIECLVRLEDGRLTIDPVGAVTAKSKEKVREELLQGLRESKVFDQIGDSRLEEVSKGASSVEVRDGKIIVKR